MRKNWNWIGTVVLVGTSMITGAVLSQMWVPVHGQPIGVSGAPLAEPVQAAPQVVVNQPGEPLKWCVDFVSLSPQIRVITVVDTETKKIAVYHLNVADGGLKWLTTRNIQPDLLVDQYNPRTPFPSEVRRDIQQLEQTRQNRQ